MYRIINDPADSAVPLKPMLPHTTETDDEAIDEKQYPLKRYRWFDDSEPTC